MPAATRPRRAAAVSRATPQPSSSPLSSPATSPRVRVPAKRARAPARAPPSKLSKAKTAPNGKNAKRKDETLDPSPLDNLLSVMQSNRAETQADTARRGRNMAALDRRPPPRDVKDTPATSSMAAAGITKTADAPRRAKRSRKRKTDDLVDDDDEDADEGKRSSPRGKTRRVSPVSSPLCPTSALTPPSSSPLSTVFDTSAVLPPYQAPMEISDDDDDDDDDLATALARRQAAQQQQAEHEEALSRVDSNLSEAEEPQSVFKPTQLPPGVEVGDTALLKVKAEWFPAKLLDFHPADAPGGRDVYVLMTEDDEVTTCGVNRVMFLHEEERLSETKIGVCAVVRARRRRTSDEPTDAYGAFRALPHEEQVRRLHDHLGDLVREAYAPAQWRTDAFFGTGAQRAELAILIDYGDFSERDVDGRVLPAVNGWFELDPADGTRARGSDRVEALDESARRAYAQDVLLPETLIAICTRSFDLERRDVWVDPPSALADADADVEQSTPKTAVSRPRGDRLQIDNIPPSGPGRTYALARLKLDELTAYTPATEWGRRKTEVTQARRAARRKRGLPDETAREAPSAAAESRDERERNQALRLQQAHDRRNARLSARRGRRAAAK